MLNGVKINGFDHHLYSFHFHINAPSQSYHNFFATKTIFRIVEYYRFASTFVTPHNTRRKAERSVVLYSGDQSRFKHVSPSAFQYDNSISSQPVSKIHHDSERESQIELEDELNRSSAWGAAWWENVQIGMPTGIRSLFSRWVIWHRFLKGNLRE